MVEEVNKSGIVFAMDDSYKDEPFDERLRK